MALFSGLPLDLLPLIVANLLDPVDVASLCLVNHTFRTFSVPKLYERISIYAWQRSSKLRVTQLFRTLAEHPNLACLVRQLVITNFPKAQDSFAYEHLGGWFTKGLENCVKLRCCTWTRDCSLTSRILKSLAKCPELTDISINGCHSDLYEPGDLLQLLRLHKISLIRPSKPILEFLPSWFQATGKSLTSLTLICKDDMYITDAYLNTVSPHLPRLERLHLVGCQRVTNEGVWSMIRNRTRDLKELSLENLSPHFDMSTLSTACTRAGGLTSLSSFTLTIHSNWSTEAWMDGAVSLLKASPLGSLNVSVRTPLKVFAEALRDRFCMRIVDQHRDHLIRFSLHGLLLNLASIDHVCLHCSKLEQLFICVDHAEMAPIVATLARANLLCAIHINIKVRPERCSLYNHALNIARQCSSTISQVGIDAEVWKVERRVLVVKSAAQVDRFLTKVENPDIPERFLVVRT
ncbi:hypothetical protein EDB85DRAFT_1997199 [Lactarius pseudohatsudake]|nr:hypothetical protein EDB85DRAFT_1997199 [Lactarius pseudohatsudake]